MCIETVVEMRAVWCFLSILFSFERRRRRRRLFLPTATLHAIYISVDGKPESRALMRLQNKHFLFGECESRDFYHGFKSNAHLSFDFFFRIEDVKELYRSLTFRFAANFTFSIFHHKFQKTEKKTI